MVYSLASIFSRFIQILLIPLYTRILNPEDYGVLSVVVTVSSLISIFVGLQLDSSAFRWYVDSEEISDRKKTIASWTWCQLTLSAIFVLLTWLFRTSLGNFVLSAEATNIGNYLVISMATVLLGTFELVLLVLFRMERRKWAIFTILVAGLTATIILTIVFVVYLDLRLYGIFYAAFISALIKTLIYLFLLGDWIAPKYFNLQRLKEMLRYSFPFVPAALFLWIVALIDRVFLVKYSSAADAGLYHIANNIASSVAIVVGGFLQAWSPFAFSISKQPNSKKTYALVLEGFLAVTCFMSLGISFFSPEVLRVLTTMDYFNAYDTVGLLCLSFVLQGVYQISGIGLALERKTSPIFYAAGLSAILNIILNFLLIPTYGRFGAAWATLLSVLVIPLYIFVVAQRTYFIPYRLLTCSVIFGITLLLIIATNSLFADVSFSAIIIKTVILVGFASLMYLQFRVELQKYSTHS